MTLDQIIEQEIRLESEKLIKRYQLYHNNLQRSYDQKVRRISTPPPKVLQKPVYWATDVKFDPFYVNEHARPIAISISRKLKAGNYRPRAPFQRQIPKPNGGSRTVNVYQIPDAAVSTFYFRKLLSKNRHRFSPYAYAYRSDRNVHFAIQDVAVDLARYSRLFVAEFDFSDFFGSIDHNFLRAQFTQNGFFITDVEQKVIESFLNLNAKGIPQGTSISLFLANLACWKLDRDLSDQTLRFARYADDTVIWTPEYSRICKAVEVIDAFSKEAKVEINLAKSEGISTLHKPNFPAEFNSKESFDFLGYKLSVGRVSIKEKSVLRIKKHISYLLYSNLIQPLLGTSLRAIVIPGNDRDEGLLSAISQIRRYLYGNLSEDKLRAYQAGAYDRIVFKGVMSFYPLINDEDQLSQLDGWLLKTIHLSLKRRLRLLEHWSFNLCRNNFPFNVDEYELLRECRRRRIHGAALLQIPSFLRIYKAIQRGLTTGGIEVTMNSANNDYHNSDS